MIFEFISMVLKRIEELIEPSSFGVRLSSRPKLRSSSLSRMRIWFACLVGEFLPPFCVSDSYPEHAGHLVDHVRRRQQDVVLRLLQVQVVLAGLEDLVRLDPRVAVSTAPPEEAWRLPGRLLRVDRVQLQREVFLPLA